MWALTWVGVRSDKAVPHAYMIGFSDIGGNIWLGNLIVVIRVALINLGKGNRILEGVNKSEWNKVMEER